VNKSYGPYTGQWHTTAAAVMKMSLYNPRRNKLWINWLLMVSLTMLFQLHWFHNHGLYHGTTPASVW